MTIKPIRNDEDLTQAFLALEKVFQAENGTSEADERDILLVLIESYEAKHYPINHASPIEAIKFKMEQQNLTRDDLVPYLGAKSKISEVLNGKRPLSLNMINTSRFTNTLRKLNYLVSVLLLSLEDIYYCTELFSFIIKRYFKFFILNHNENR